MRRIHIHPGKIGCMYRDCIDTAPFSGTNATSRDGSSSITGSRPTDPPRDLHAPRIGVVAAAVTRSAAVDRKSAHGGKR